MIRSNDGDRRHAEISEEKIADARALPLLRSYRERLEREAGELGAKARRHQMWVLVLAAAAGSVGAYAFWLSVTAHPPIVAWVVAAVLATGAAAAAQRRSRTHRERTQYLEALHEKMRAAGRRIDAAERRLRT